MRRKLKTIIALCLCVMMLPTGALAMSWNEFVTKANTISTQNPGGQTVLDSDSLGLGEGETIDGYGTSGWGILSLKDALLRGLTFVGELYIGDGIYRLEDVTIVADNNGSYGLYLSAQGDSELYIDSDSKIGSADDPMDRGIYATLYGDGSIKIVNDGEIYADIGMLVNTSSVNAVTDITNNGHIEAREGIAVQAMRYVRSGEFDADGNEIWKLSDINADITISNNGSIVAAETAIRAYGAGGDGTIVLFVDNSGEIVATGWTDKYTDGDTGEVSYYENGNGILANINMENGSGILGVTNSGEIIISRPGVNEGNTVGIDGRVDAANGDINVKNTGDINAETGINVYAEHYVPTGKYDEEGYEIWSYADINANVGVNNSGNINATREGISASAYGAGGKVVLFVDNSGNIVATGRAYTGTDSDTGEVWYYEQASGIVGSINMESGSGILGVTNTGEIIVSRASTGNGNAIGIDGSLNANSGDVDVNNSGNIDAETGINVYAEHYVPTGEYDEDGYEIWKSADFNANVGVNNSGSINATREGISAYMNGAEGNVVLLIDNSGKIVATATESYVDTEGVTWYQANGISAGIGTENTSGLFGITNSGEIISNGTGLFIGNYGTAIPIVLNGEGNISGGEVTDENGVAYSRDIVLQMVLSNASGMTEEERNAYVKTMLEQSGILNYQNGNVEVRIYDETTWESFECIVETEKAAPPPKVHPKCGNISYSDEWLKQAWLCGGSRNLRLYTGPDMEERILFKENVSFAPDDAGKVLTLITNKKVTGTAFAKLGTDMIRMMLNRNINTLVIQTGDTTDVYPLAVIWDALVAAGHEDCQAVLLGGMNGDAMIINSAGEVEAL